MHAHEHAHESPTVMLVPLGVLAVGAVFAGMVWYGPFFGDHDRVSQFFHMPHHAAGAEHASTDPADHVTARGEAAAPTAPTDEAVDPAAADPATGATNPEDAPAHADGETAVVAAPVGGAIYMHPDNHVMDEAHHAPVWVKVSPFVAMLIGLGLAYAMYIRNPAAPARLAATQRPLYRFLLNKWYFDELYDWVFVRPVQWIGRALWKGGDQRGIDGVINGVAMGLIPRLTRFAGRVQSGYLFHYAFGMVLGLVALLLWVTARSMN